VEVPDDCACLCQYLQQLGHVLVADTSVNAELQGMGKARAPSFHGHLTNSLLDVDEVDDVETDHSGGKHGIQLSSYEVGGVATGRWTDCQALLCVAKLSCSQCAVTPMYDRLMDAVVMACVEERSLNLGLHSLVPVWNLVARIELIDKLTERRRIN